MATGPGLRIIREDERLTYDGDGFKIFYRRIPNFRRGAIQEKYRKRGGEINISRATDEMLEYCVTGWSGFFYDNEEGRRIDVAYDPKIVRAIPDDVLVEIVDLCGANADSGVVEAKNLPTTSDSSERSTDSPADNADERPARTTPSPSSAT